MLFTVKQQCRFFSAIWCYCCLVAVHIVFDSSMNHLSNALAFGNFVSPRKLFSSLVKQKGDSDSIETQRKLLFTAINGTNNGKTASVEQQQNILNIVRSIELSNPVLSISDPAISQLINGTWYLQYTSPSAVASDFKTEDDVAPSLPVWEPLNAEEGSSNIETRQFRAKGSVSAAGVVVDTSNKLVQQVLDVVDQKVINKVNFDWGNVVVSGKFRQSPTIANRAIVAFDKADICFSMPNSDKKNAVIHLGWVFSVIAAFRNGIRDNGWLETTYVDKTLRLGRGNKGTMFILTREPSI